MTTLSGPIFEAAHGPIWRSTFNREGGHYNIFDCKDDDGMAALRSMFIEYPPDSERFVLFSTSGVHGTYATIESAEREFLAGLEAWEEGIPPKVTFLIVQTRTVTLRYGNCKPQSAEDFQFLKDLRAESLKVIAAGYAPFAQ